MDYFVGMFGNLKICQTASNKRSVNVQAAEQSLTASCCQTWPEAKVSKVYHDYGVELLPRDFVRWADVNTLSNVRLFKGHSSLKDLTINRPTDRSTEPAECCWSDGEDISDSIPDGFQRTRTTTRDERQRKEGHILRFQKKKRFFSTYTFSPSSCCCKRWALELLFFFKTLKSVRFIQYNLYSVVHENLLSFAHCRK